MKQTHNLYRHIITFAVAAMLLAMGCVFFLLYKFNSTFQPAFPGPNRADWGVLGDYFGGTLGPVLNLITVGMLVASFLFQHQQIKDAKADASEAQQQANNELRILLKQSFEQTFFAWLKSYHEFVSSITKWDTENDNRVLQGREALNYLWKTGLITNRVAYIASEAKVADRGTILTNLRRQAEGHEYDQNLAQESILIAFRDTYRAHSSSLGTMFRTLYRLIKWVDESDLSPMEKYSYVAIVRSQLSMNELAFLLINGLTDRGQKFRTLVNKYALFDNIEPHPYVSILSAFSAPLGYERSAFDSVLAKNQLR